MSEQHLAADVVLLLVAKRKLTRRWSKDWYTTKLGTALRATIIGHTID